ncbi:hypothetical protein BH11MYX1_BH11MYX1_26000 [soil metagenome]
MATEEELVAAIADSPEDATRLVYADWLLAHGDRRGELIMLDYKERTTPGGITSPDQTGQLLRLAAELGFPVLPDPDRELLAFEPDGRAGQWKLHWHDQDYFIRVLGSVTLVVGSQWIENQSFNGYGSQLLDEQVNALLTIMLRVIHNGVDFSAFRFPSPAQLASLPAYRLGPHPLYPSAEVMEDFGAEWKLRARDHERWYTIYDRMMKGFSRTSSFRAVKDSVT